MLLVGDFVYLKKKNPSQSKTLKKQYMLTYISKYYGNYTTNSNNVLSITKYNKKHFSCICNRHKFMSVDVYVDV